MAENSNIAWTDHTFNPWWGCQRVGPGCDNCYAATLDKRTGGDHWDGKTLPRRTKEANWQKPLKWNKEAAQKGIRYKVFCASMADVFDNRIPEEWRNDLWDLIRATPNLDWLLLTKRIGNVNDMLPDDWGYAWRNVWIGMTAVNQTEYDRDIIKLQSVSAWVRFLSLEPLIAPIELHHIGLVEWVIVGAESGPGARPFNEEWARDLRDQCQHLECKFFYKQNVIDGKKIETPEIDGERWTEFPKSYYAPTSKSQATA